MQYETLPVEQPVRVRWTCSTQDCLASAEGPPEFVDGVVAQHVECVFEIPVGE